MIIRQVHGFFQPERQLKFPRPRIPREQRRIDMQRPQLRERVEAEGVRGACHPERPRAMADVASVVRITKQDKSVRSKQDRRGSWRVDEENGLGMLGGRGSEDGEVTVWMEAADDFCTGRPVDAQACGAEGDTAVGIDAGAGALTPDARPPRAGWSGTQSRALLAESELPCGLRRGADLAMLFRFVAMDPQLVEQGLGRAEGGDGFGGEDRGQALLPEVAKTTPCSRNDPLSILTFSWKC